MSDVVRFYSHRRGPHACLSNFYPSTFRLDGFWWPTVEHFFQAAKFFDPMKQNAVRLAASPAEAKRLGRSPGMRGDWDDARVLVMHRALRAKFTQCRSLGAILLATGDATLIEAAPRDFYWGEGDGSGKNMLGRLLMQVRTELR